MKKIFIAIAVGLISLSANAQIYVGGGISLTVMKNSLFSIKPEVGYNINDNWAAGGVLEFESGDRTTSFGIKPYARWTFVKLGPANLFLDGYLSFSNTSNSEFNISSNTFGLGVSPGLAIPLTDHLSFVGHLGYIKYENIDKESAFSFELSGSAFTAGLYYSF